jgi:hypothetical protein
MNLDRNATPSRQVDFARFILEAKDHYFVAQLAGVDGQVPNNLENTAGSRGYRSYEMTDLHV